MTITLWKLKMLFRPSLFDSMEHLPVHLAYKAKVGGPQQYRWMYLFERFLRTLKDKIKNPRYVEVSIAEAFLVQEATKFASYYYPPEMISRWRGVPHNDDGGDTSNHISIFNFPGRVVGKHCRSTMKGKDKRVAEYILNNCEEAAPYFSNWVRSTNPLISDSEVEQFTNSEFPQWLQSYFMQNRSAPHDVACSLSYTAATVVTRCRKYVESGEVPAESIDWAAFERTHSQESKDNIVVVSNNVLGVVAHLASADDV
ncbi:hypothetical protein K1719_034677 [Acacia pycnantha]|nr:hypothetical protein K1719_034677 [Acacia pycnantha]